MLTHLPYSSHIMHYTTLDMATISKMGPTIAVGLLKLRVRRQNPPVGSAQPRVDRMKDKAT
jgi:hypothetical protein